TAHIRQQTGMDVEVMWGDEGFVVRFPEVERAPDAALLLPDAEDVEGLVLRQLGSTSLFAARFRESAARALLLPRRRPGARTPLWAPPTAAGPPHAALAATEASGRSVSGGVALRIVSHSARDLSRAVPRSLRHA